MFRHSYLARAAAALSFGLLGKSKEEERRVSSTIELEHGSIMSELMPRRQRRFTPGAFGRVKGYKRLARAYGPGSYAEWDSQWRERSEARKQRKH